MKTYIVPVDGNVKTEIEVEATSKEEAIQLTYKELWDDNTSRFHINWFFDTCEEDVEEVDVESEKGVGQ